MNLTLDSPTEQRIQRELDRSTYSEPAEVINHALDLLETDQSWSDQEKADLDDRLDRSLAAIKRGEGIPRDDVRDLLAQRFALRPR